MFRHETATHLSGNVTGVNDRIWAAAIRMKWMKLKKTAQTSTYFVLHKKCSSLSFSYFSFSESTVSRPVGGIPHAEFGKWGSERHGKSIRRDASTFSHYNTHRNLPWNLTQATPSLGHLVPPTSHHELLLLGIKNVAVYIPPVVAHNLAETYCSFRVWTKP